MALSNKIYSLILICILFGCKNDPIIANQQRAWIKVKEHHVMIDLDTTDFNSSETAEIHFTALEYYKIENQFIAEIISSVNKIILVENQRVSWFYLSNGKMKI